MFGIKPECRALYQSMIQKTLERERERERERELTTNAPYLVATALRGKQGLIIPY